MNVVPVTVIANHLRSFLGITNPADGMRIRAKRAAQAEFLARLIQARPLTERVIVVGDFNAFPFNDGLVDVMGTVAGRPAPADQVALATPDLVNPDLMNLATCSAHRDTTRTCSMATHRPSITSW